MRVEVGAACSNDIKGEQATVRAAVTERVVAAPGQVSDGAAAVRS